MVAAIEVLKSIPQSTVAYQIGVSERRLRDIEHGRSTPRQKTREAIMRFAQEVSKGKAPAGRSAFEGDEEPRVAISPIQWQPLQAATGSPAYAGLIGLGIFAASIIVVALLGSGSQE